MASNKQCRQARVRGPESANQGRGRDPQRLTVGDVVLAAVIVGCLLSAITYWAADEPTPAFTNIPAEITT